MDAARKKAIYKLADDAIQRMPGRLGLKLGAIPDMGAIPLLGMAIMGGCDWGPWGIGRRLSREVESSIYLLTRGFTTGILHAVSPTLPIRLDNFVGGLPQRDCECANIGKVSMEEQDRNTQPHDEGEKGTRPLNGVQEVYHCYWPRDSMNRPRRHRELPPP